MPWGVWTAGDEAKLRTAYAVGTPPDEVARELGRTRGAVVMAASRLRLGHEGPIRLRQRQAALPALTDAEWGYVAGMIDGEGTIGVYSRGKQHCGSRQRTPGRSYRPRIQIANTSRALMDWLVAKLGGRVQVRRLVVGHKLGYNWSTNDVAHPSHMRTRHAAAGHQS